MRRRTMAVLGAVVSACVLLASRRAEAQSAEDKTASEALFEEGKRLLAEKRFGEACARFASSQELDPGVGTLLFLADCYETIGRTASAWSTFREAASAGRSTGQLDRERIARERAAKLEDKLFRLTILAPNDGAAPGLQVKRNDVPIRKELWGTAVPVDPGTYKIAAVAPGKKPWSTTVEIPAARGSRKVEIPALEDAPAPPPGPTAAATPAPVVIPVAPAPAGYPAGRAVGLGVIFTGLAGLAGGAVLGGIAASQVSRIEERCPQVRCGDPDTVALSKQAGTMADVSTALFVGGGTAVAAGVVLFYATPAPAAHPGVGRTTWLAPRFDGASAGVGAGASW